MTSVVAEAASPLDAVPDPAGLTVYFTAFDPTAGAAVFRVPADGSATTPVLVSSGVFGAPFGLTVSTDGQTLFVSDPLAVDSTGVDEGGIWSLPVSGGSPTLLSGSAGTRARGVDLVAQPSGDQLFFTGRNPADGLPGLFRLPAAGGSLTVLKEGPPFVDPSGVAVAHDGTAFVLDTFAGADGTASVLQVTAAGVASTLLAGLRVGYPAGLALSKDDTVLYVSSLSSDAGVGQVLALERASGLQSVVSPVGFAGTEPAGLHGGKQRDVLTWVESSVGPSGGRVYVRR